MGGLNFNDVTDPSHYNFVLNEKPYPCEFTTCDRSYSTSHSRRQHYRRHHSKEVLPTSASSIVKVKCPQKRRKSCTNIDEKIINNCKVKNEDLIVTKSESCLSCAIVPKLEDSSCDCVSSAPVNSINDFTSLSSIRLSLPVSPNQLVPDFQDTNEFDNNNANYSNSFPSWDTTRPSSPELHSVSCGFINTNININTNDDLYLGTSDNSIPKFENFQNIDFFNDGRLNLNFSAIPSIREEEECDRLYANPFDCSLFQNFNHPLKFEANINTVDVFGQSVLSKSFELQAYPMLTSQ